MYTASSITIQHTNKHTRGERYGKELWKWLFWSKSTFTKSHLSICPSQPASQPANSKQGEGEFWCLWKDMLSCRPISFNLDGEKQLKYWTCLIYPFNINRVVFLRSVRTLPYFAPPSHHEPVRADWRKSFFMEWFFFGTVHFTDAPSKLQCFSPTLFMNHKHLNRKKSGELSRLQMYISSFTR